MLYKFEESQYFCIRQIKFVTENIQLIKIAYFNQASMKPFLISEFSNNNFANKKEVLEYCIPDNKGNNHSLLYFPKNRKKINEDNYEVKLIDVVLDNLSPRLRTRSLKTPISITADGIGKDFFFWEFKAN